MSDARKDFNCILEIIIRPDRVRFLKFEYLRETFVDKSISSGIQNFSHEKFVESTFIVENVYYIQFKNEHFAEYGSKVAYRAVRYKRHRENNFNSQLVQYAPNVKFVYGPAQSVYDLTTIKTRRVYIVPQSDINDMFNELQLAQFINEWYERLNLCKIPGVPPVLFVHLDGKDSFVEMRRYVDGVSFLNFNGFVFEGVEFSIVSSRADVWYEYRFQFYNWKELIEMKPDDLHLGMDHRFTSVVVMVHYQGSRISFDDIVLREIEGTRKKFESSISHNCILSSICTESPDKSYVRYFVETSTIEQARQLRLCFEANNQFGNFIEYYDEKFFAIGSFFEPCLVYSLSKRLRQ